MTRPNGIKYFGDLRIELTLLGLGIMTLVATLHPEIHTDGQVRYSVVEAVLNGTPVPPIKYSLVQPYLSIPIARLAQLLAADPKTLVAYFNVIVANLLGCILYVELKHVYSERIAVRFFLLLLCGSMIPHNLQAYYGEIFSTFAISSAVLLPRRQIFASVLLAFGLANTPVLIIPAGIAALMVLRRHPALLAGVLLATALFILENTLKYGSLFQSPYLLASEKGVQTILPYSGKPGFSYPLFFGVLSIVFSFGKGLLFFIPGLLLLVDESVRASLHRNSPTRLAFLAAGVMLVLVYAKWWAWYGGVFWGPRFFIILTIPAALALALKLASTRSGSALACAITILLLSTWVGINGVIFANRGLGMCFENNYQQEMLCWFVPEFSALWHPFVRYDLPDLLGFILRSKRFPFAAWQASVCVYLSVATLLQVRQGKD